MTVTNSNKIMIIGGAGFVGSSLANLFQEKNIDFCIGDINTESQDTIKLDVEDIDSLSSMNGSQTIINLAAVHRDDIRPISRYDEVNINGARNVCKAARKYGINKIIFTSSVAIYGFAPANTNEYGEPNYFNDYGRTKYFAEQVYKEWQAEDPLNRTLVIVRPTVIFGKGNRGNVFNLLKQVASKKFLMFGNGKNKKSMAYVENVVAFLEYCLYFKPGLHIYNYIDKPDFDMNSLVSIIREELFKKNNVGIRLPAALGLLGGYCADIISKITGKALPVSLIRVKKFLGTTQFGSSIFQTKFVPPVSLEEGLKKTIHYEFIEDNSDKKTFETE